MSAAADRQRAALSRDLADFDAFWVVYPRKIGKGAARRKFEQAVKRISGRMIIFAVQDQLAAGMFDHDPKFIPHPATWLHQERYDDEIVHARRPIMRNGALEALVRGQEGNPLLEHGGDD